MERNGHQLNHMERNGHQLNHRELGWNGLCMAYSRPPYSAKARGAVPSSASRRGVLSHARGHQAGLSPPSQDRPPRHWGSGPLDDGSEPHLRDGATRRTSWALKQIELTRCLPVTSNGPASADIGRYSGAWFTGFYPATSSAAPAASMKPAIWWIGMGRLASITRR